LSSCDANGDNCYQTQGAGTGNPAQQKPLVISKLQKSGKNYDKVVGTLNKITDTIDPQCLSFLQSGGNNLQSTVDTLLSGNLLAVGSFVSGYAAITQATGTNLAPGDAAIVVNSLSAFFNFDQTVDQGKYQGGTAGADAFILLHELAHLLEAKKFQPDGPSVPNSAQAGKDNDKLIDQNCQKTLGGFK